ncbi:MAG: winged helix-turn-helix transcriptional regulator [Anaerolineae bacterium]|nr:winged helix-turn-helix transcriptional regulator [Anaerolineae bacterium]
MEQGLKQELETLHEQICAALADTNRLQLLYLLAQGPLRVTELTTELALPQSTVSRHLRVLRERGLVETDRQGPSVYYSLADKRVIEAIDLLRGILHDRVMRQARAVQELDG